MGWSLISKFSPLEQTSRTKGGAMEIKYLSDSFGVSGQITPSQVEQLADEGFKTIVCNRPDGEEPGQPTSSEISQKAEGLNIEFHYIPMVGPNFTPADVEKLKAVISNNEKVFSYCRTGNRSSILWNAAQGN